MRASAAAGTPPFNKRAAAACADCSFAQPESTVSIADFKGLRKIEHAAADAFRIGLVLFDGDKVLPFGDRLYAAPISCLWEP